MACACAGRSSAGFEPPPRAARYLARVKAFMDEHVYAAEPLLEVRPCLCLCTRGVVKSVTPSTGHVGEGEGACLMWRAMDARKIEEPCWHGQSRMPARSAFQNLPCHDQELAGTDKRWTVHPRMEEMKAAARAQGLWNLWVSPDLAARIRPALPERLSAEDELLLGAGLSNLVRRACLRVSCEV